jgi:hypothetical protein
VPFFDLASNAMRPAGWTSADAAGLPVFAGLARYDEVAAGAITHALRFTCPTTRRAYIPPARHYASSQTNPNLPPMGMRVRLKANVDISTFPPDVQVILTGAQEVRDDPGRQRQRLLRERRTRSPLERREHRQHETHQGFGLRGRSHDRDGLLDGKLAAAFERACAKSLVCAA